MRRHDAANSGHSDAGGDMAEAPRERWRLDTGADIRTVREVAVAASPWVIVLADSNLQAFDDAGDARWSRPTLPVSRLIAGGDLDGSGDGCLLVRTGSSTLVLLDAVDGHERWRWSAEPGTFIHDHAGVLLVPIEGGHRIVVCATYASHIEAFDLVGSGPPQQRWRLRGPWDPGFGPSIIAIDMNGDGQLELVLSSRLGDTDRTRDGRSSTAELVLGRRNGQLYQAVHSLEDGRLLDQVAYAPQSRGWRCARPYGLLAAAPGRPGELPAVAMVSCQVEEYLAVTRRTSSGGLARAWGHFVEKDWPVDERELRVHPDGLTDIDGDGRAELLVSLWEEGRWRTLVLDPMAGWNVPLAEIHDRVLWGCVARPDGTAAMVLSEEHARATGGPTVVELRGPGLELLGRRTATSIVISPDSPLPPGVAFMARRRSGAKVTLPDGREGMAIRRWHEDRVTSIGLWCPDLPGARPLTVARGDATRVDAAAGGVLVSRQDGSVLPVAVSSVDGVTGPGSRLASRRRGSPLRARGRVAAPLVWHAPEGPMLGVDVAGGQVVVGRVVGSGTLRGRRVARGRWVAPAGRRGRAAGLLLGAADGRSVRWLDPRTPETQQPQADTADLDAPLVGAVMPMPDDRYVATLRTGVHTQATEIRTYAGERLVRLENGAYLHPPAVLELPDGPLVIIDDHGILIAIEPGGLERWRRDWTAAYSLPITGPFLGPGRQAVLRANGIHGLELLDARGRRRWRLEAPLWTYAAGAAAVFRLADGAHVVAQPRRDGKLEVITLSTGQNRWHLDLGNHIESASVTAGDVDGDGLDELLVGLPDGRLLCVADVEATPIIRWSVDLGAGVSDAFLAVINRQGRTGIVVATSDGAVRILKR